MNGSSDAVAPVAASPSAYELPISGDELLWRVWLSAQWLPAVTVADELDLFDYLDTAPMTVAQVASRHNLDERGITALLRTLAALGFLTLQNGLYHLTDVSRAYLRKASPHYSAAFLRLGQDIRHGRLLT